MKVLAKNRPHGNDLLRTYAPVGATENDDNESESEIFAYEDKSYNIPSSLRHFSFRYL